MSYIHLENVRFKKCSLWQLIYIQVVSEDINELEKIKDELENMDPTVNLMKVSEQPENTSHAASSGDHIVQEGRCIYCMFVTY